MTWKLLHWQAPQQNLVAVSTPAHGARNVAAAKSAITTVVNPGLCGPPINFTPGQ